MRPLKRDACAKVVFLVHRQRVHVGAQADRAAAVLRRSPRNHGDDPGLADVAVMLDAERGELARDDLDGAVLLEAQLGMRVQVAPQGGQCGVVLA